MLRLTIMQYLTLNPKPEPNVIPNHNDIPKSNALCKPNAIPSSNDIHKPDATNKPNDIPNS